MKTYSLTIKPLSGFGTPLKGDTLFGHICWQAAYDEALFGKSIDALLSDYALNPFMVVSSAYPKFGDLYALRRPHLPFHMLFAEAGQTLNEKMRNRKELKKKEWILVSAEQRFETTRSAAYKDSQELLNMAAGHKKQRQNSRKTILADFAQPHNTINRMTGTTGEDRFAPFSVDQTVFTPDLELVVFVGLREDIKIKDAEKALRQIGETGFGKDASTGLGRFAVGGCEEIDLNSLGSSNPTGCYTLAPCLPQKDKFYNTYFSPFTRFGRHGDVMAKSGKPFKNPVIMADEGSVFMPLSSELFNRKYIGTAISGVSKAQPETVVQGYSLFIPVRVEA
ncbi:MAG: hypothetical protein EPN22_02260 [Nitrospirae bacterium]|nr:MAG: hypothetical protein EPN22_02260 [Nitrospirota bacterium]